MSVIHSSPNLDLAFLFSSGDVTEQLAAPSSWSFITIKRMVREHEPGGMQSGKKSTREQRCWGIVSNCAQAVPREPGEEGDSEGTVVGAKGKPVEPIVPGRKAQQAFPAALCQERAARGHMGHHEPYLGPPLTSPGLFLHSRKLLRVLPRGHQERETGLATRCSLACDFPPLLSMFMLDFDPKLKIHRNDTNPWCLP